MPFIQLYTGDLFFIYIQVERLKYYIPFYFANGRLLSNI